MDFIVGLPTTQKRYDAIWVIVDQLTKSTHFLPIKVKFNLDQLPKLYVKKIRSCQIEIHGSRRIFGRVFKNI